MYLGLDIGTQSLKAVVCDEALRPIGEASVAYKPSYPQPGWAEQNSRDWLTALGPAIAGALKAAKMDASDLSAMAVCGQLDGCIATDRNGDAMAPAMLWMDRRASGSLAGIDPGLVRDRAGLVLDGTHVAAKIRWSRLHLANPEDVAVWHQPVSFIVEALTGVRTMDRCLASTTMLYNLATQQWDQMLLESFGVYPETLPAVADAASIAGHLNLRGAELTGLNAGLPVAVGTGDDFSNLIGGGVCRPGTVAVMLGTSEAIGTLADRAIIDPQMLVETHCFPGGYYHLGNPGWMSGGAIRWFMSVFSVASATDFSALAAEAPPGCDGLLFIPALSGAMAPRWLPGARGVFHGMTAAHGKAHFARAVLEGTAYAMRDVIDRLSALGAPADRIRVMGGGAASAVWTQIRADLTGKPVDRLTGSDASALGAAVLAAVAVGGWPDVGRASAALSLPLLTATPLAANMEIYSENYGRYRRLFHALEPIFEETGNTGRTGL